MSVRLLDIEPELGRFLDDEDRAEARGLAVPVRTVARGTEDVAAKLEPAGAFGAIVLEGLLVQTLRLGDRTAVRLLGAGDIVSAHGAPQLAALDEAPVQAAASTRLALLGKELLAASRRWPLLVPGLHIQLARQADRLAAQLVICQIPRVEDRLMALMWLLADSWGRVTLDGTVLPVRLTHGTLGALIGARRPTITLALGELTKRGALVSQDQGWLLVEGPPGGGKSTTEVRMPTLAPVPSPEPTAGATNHAASSEFEHLSAACAELSATVSRLRRRHERDKTQFRRTLRQLESSRKQVQTSRRRRQRERLNHRQPPSS